MFITHGRTYTFVSTARVGRSRHAGHNACVLERVKSRRKKYWREKNSGSIPSIGDGASRRLREAPEVARLRSTRFRDARENNGHSREKYSGTSYLFVRDRRRSSRRQNTSQNFTVDPSRRFSKQPGATSSKAVSLTAGAVLRSVRRKRDVSPFPLQSRSRCSNSVVMANRVA